MGTIKKKMQKTSLYQWAVREYRKKLLYKEFYTSNQEGKENTVVFVLDKNMPHPGLVDRIKAIVCVYYIAKVNQLDFLLYSNLPLKLEDYLEPISSENDWRNRENLVSWNKKQVKLFEYRPFKKVPSLYGGIGPRNKQYHCWYYSGHNILQENHIENWEQIWSDMYHELFQPNARLRTLLDDNMPKEPFTAVHFRFVNALDKFEEGYESNLTTQEQEDLITKSILQIEHIQKQEQKKILVFADSKRFLDIVREKGYETLDNHNVGHVSFSEDTAVYDKVFIDFYTISNADKIYCIRGRSLYDSVFPMYAAIVGRHEYVFNYID